MVGGSSRIPGIQQIVSEFFGGIGLSKCVNPDEAVAYGAAVQVALLPDGKCMVSGRQKLLDVTPLSLGIENAGGVMDTIVPRNTRIPTKKSVMRCNCEDNQKEVRIAVFEGEREMVAENSLLGNVTLTGVTPAKRGYCKLRVTFEIVLHISATDDTSGKASS